MAVASSCGGFFVHRLFYVLPNPLNRITAATDNTRRFGLSNLRYDKNGNITHLTRGGHLKEMPDWDKDDDFGTMDQLDYQYFDGSNRLRSVTDGILKNDTSGKGEFVDGNKDGDDYVYDPNGNMTQDLNKGIKGATLAEKGIEYNHLNLPTLVRVHNGADVGTFSYIYDATGVKLRKNVLKQGETTPTATDYAGNYIYENNKLQFFSTTEGYAEPKNPDNLSLGYDYIYQYKDHLGNIRLSYKDVSTTSTPSLEIQEENNYYPFGLKHKGYNGMQSAARNHKYGFGGKEEQDELGLEWLDFSARNYDASLGRWMNLDPLAEKYMDLSPYHYVGNNPTIFIDDNGEDYSIFLEKNEDGDWQIRIEAVYYVKKGDKDALSSAKAATSAWNKKKDFALKVGKGRNASQIGIVFDLTVSEEFDPEEQMLHDNMGDSGSKTVDGNSNTYSLASESEIKRKGDSYARGVTTGKNSILVPDSRETELKVGMHEIGHTLGLDDGGSGVMDPGGDSSITQWGVEEIIEFAIKTIKTYPNNRRITIHGDLPKGKVKSNISNLRKYNPYYDK